MTNNASVTLSGGVWVDGALHREAHLRPLTGRDEEFLAQAKALLMAEQAHAVLARCLTRLGPHQPASLEAVRALTIGDRESLLLHLRRLTLGEAMPCVLHCPDCNKPMDVDLRVKDLLLPAPDRHAPDYETTLEDEAQRYHVRFRLPTGADQEALAGLARRDPDAAAVQWLGRCVAEVTDDDGQVVPVEECLPVLLAQLPAIMAELDPQAELILNVRCPACSIPFSALFDTATFFFREIMDRARFLYREIHLLAFHYHWSEAEILSLTSTKRHRYLELLAEEFSGGLAL